MTDSVRDQLGWMPLFAGLDQAQLAQVAEIVTDRTYEKGEIIFHEGDEGDGFYIGASGRVKIYKLSPEGKEQILHLWGPAEPFGEVALFSGQAMPATALAITRARVFFFPRARFARLIAANPALALNMLAAMSIRLHQFARVIENLSLKEAPGRLAGYLLETAISGRLTLTMTKAQLANMLGATPETFSRVLGRMVESGLIAARGQEIELIDRESLQLLAQAEARLSDLVRD